MTCGGRYIGAMFQIETFNASRAGQTKLSKTFIAHLQAEGVDMGMKMLMVSVPGVPGEDYPILQQVKLFLDFSSGRLPVLLSLSRETLVLP